MEDRSESAIVDVPERLYVPCFWPGCHTRHLFTSLMTHIKSRHKEIAKHFGCHHCGYTNEDKNVVQSHVDAEHARRDKILLAPSALAQFYRSLYIHIHPQLASLPLSIFKAHEYRNREKHLFNKIQEAVKKAKETPGRRNTSSIEALPPASQSIISEYREWQRVAKIDLDIEKIKEQCVAVDSVSTRAAFSSDAATNNFDESGCETEDDSGFTHNNDEDDDLVGVDYFDNENDEVGVEIADEGDDGSNVKYMGSDDGNNDGYDKVIVNNADKDDGSDNEQADSDDGDEGTSAEANESAETGGTPPPDLRRSRKDIERISDIRKQSEDSLLTVFMSCVKEDSITIVDEVLQSYSTKTISGKPYRVHKELPAVTSLTPDSDIIHAIPTAAGWQCGVPQCGATSSHLFVMDLHLRAHGLTHLTKWYCREGTCFNGYEKSFEDRDSLNTHITEEHWNSAYISLAISRVPRQGIRAFELSRHLNMPPRASPKSTSKKASETLERPASTRTKPLKTLDQNQRTVTKYDCPWPECDHSVASADMADIHFLSKHLNCVWQCQEPECEHCFYIRPVDLVRHHMLCHVGSPLQCGHPGCDRVLSKGSYLTRGYYSQSRLQSHLQMVFNREICNTSGQSLPKLDSGGSNSQQMPSSDLPSEAQYLEGFRGKSELYLTPERRRYRQEENHRLVVKRGFDPLDIRVTDSRTCEGFSYGGNHHFPCADSVDMTLETAILLFIPDLSIFTLAQTCDYCIYAMSATRRPVADRPSPMNFGVRDFNAKGERKCRVERRGKGSTINDHDSFMEVYGQDRERLPISSMATKYAQLQVSNPDKIFIVDFEAVRPSKKNLPFMPLEVTVRNGRGKIIVSHVINKKNVTNRQYNAELKEMGFTPDDIRRIYRIRGLAKDILPKNARTPKYIVRKLLKAGLGPDILWVEYSNTFFNLKYMRVLLALAGHSAESINTILPPRSSCWTVFPELARCLPGLNSYALGDVLKLMNPDHPSLEQLHFSAPDTAALHELLRNWIYVYGPLQDDDGNAEGVVSQRRDKAKSLWKKD